MIEGENRSAVADYIDAELEKLYSISARELEAGLRRLRYFVAREPEGGVCLFLCTWMQEKLHDDFVEALASMGFYHRSESEWMTWPGAGKPGLSFVRERERMRRARAGR